MDTSLPSGPDVPTYRYPFAGMHPGALGHMHGEAPIRPPMDMGPRIRGSVPSPHYRNTDKYTRKDGHMCGHIGKRGRSHRKKGGWTVIWARGPSYGLGCACGPIYLHVEVNPVRSFWKKDPASMYRWVGGWKKWGPDLGKKGGDPEKPPPDGGKWGWISEGGEKSPRAPL